MGLMCDFCGEQRSMVYCRSDAACLCFSCDCKVHSANALSKRHLRTLVCERCISQPAAVRCIEERVSLCQNCDWMGHGPSSQNHKRQTISSYSGCPSAAELSSVLSFGLDFSSMTDTTCEQELRLLNIAEDSAKPSLVPSEDKNTPAASAGIGTCKANDCSGSSSLPEQKSTLQSLGQQITSSATASLSKVEYPFGKPFEDHSLYEDFDMDEVDINFENYEELFGNTRNNSEILFDNGGIDSLFAMKDKCAADSTCHGAAVAEVSTSHLVINTTKPACSAASADSAMSAMTEPIICLTPTTHAISFSGGGVNVESTGGDYQDCGASSPLLMGEPPWCPPPGSDPLLPSSANRSDAVLRYREKKKTRKFEKTVRYASRKARADVRRRVKGRFVKAGEAYDYDPLSPTRSY